jgi:hypothetical protein
MKFSSLVILSCFFCNYAKAQNLSSISLLKSKIDSIYTSPSDDLLPSEFISSALENEYYCESANYKGHVFVLRLRDNHSLISETYYKPYHWSRLSFTIGNYRTSGDTIYITYKPLLKGKTDAIYVSPIVPVSWTLPGEPKYLLLKKGRLFDPYFERNFYAPNNKTKFEVENRK